MGAQNSSDKARLNVLRTKDVRHVRVRSSTEQNNKADKRRDNRVGIGGDNEVGTRRQDNKVDTRE